MRFAKQTLWLSIFMILFASNLSAAKISAEHLREKGKKISAEHWIEKAMGLLLSFKSAKNPKLNIEKEFKTYGNATLDKAQVILLPDGHADLASRFINLRVIREYSRAGDIVMQEGGDADTGPDCFDKSVMGLLPTHGELTRAMEPAFVAALDKKRIDLPGRDRRLIWPHAPEMLCSSWDSVPLVIEQFNAMTRAGGEKEAAAISKKRNALIIKSIKREHREGRRVFIMAGSLHLPYTLKSSFGAYEAHLGHTREEAKAGYANYLGSVRNLETYLKTVPHIALVPKWEDELGALLDEPEEKDL